MILSFFCGSGVNIPECPANAKPGVPGVPGGGASEGRSVFFCGRGPAGFDGGPGGRPGGREAEKAGRWLDAAETYRAVAERHPAAPEAEEARSLASGIEGSAPYREAREDADREHLAQNKLGLARNYLHNRQHAKARELLSEILRDYPKTGAAKEARGLLERL